MRFNDIVLLAFKNISHKGLMSWLTTIGIIIGIASVVTLITLGNGITQTIIEMMGVLSSDNIYVFKGSSLLSSNQFIAGRKVILTRNDVNSIRNIPGIKATTPAYLEIYPAEFKGEQASITLRGMIPSEWVHIFRIELEAGRKVVDSDTNSIVIGQLIAHDFFEEEVKVNDDISINNKTFKVVGILKSSGSSRETDLLVFIHWRELKKMSDTFDEDDDMFAILSNIHEGYDIMEIEEDIKEALRNNHHVLEGEEDFSVFSSDSLQNTVGDVLGILTAFVSGIAAISLLVSGIGIANTMFMSVMERTREIGIMKAIGAEDKTIMYLFIIESAIFGLVGGIIGTLFGFFIAYLINIFINISISFSIPLAIFALFFSTITGAVAGWLPAKRASKLNVITALKQE